VRRGHRAKGFIGFFAAAAGAFALSAASYASSTSAPKAIAIVGATVFDATGATPHPATVVIKDGRIFDIGSQVRIPRGATVIRAKGAALLPGFFDLHTHWTASGDPGTTPQIASAYVAAGVTTVNDFNAAPESYEPRRRWLASLIAPHVNFAARVSTPGGHGADWADVATTKWVNTPEAARAAIQGLIPYKPDLIKAFTDGWRYGNAPDNTSMDEWTLSALVEEAHKNSLRVFTHTVTVDRGALAARAHVDVITHSLQDRPLDAEAIASIKANGTAITPTLAVYEPVKPGQSPPQNRDDPKVQQGFRKFGFALQNVKALHDAGVMIALGTDAGMPGTQHGFSTLHEMELLVQAGLTPTEALMAATANSATLMNQIADRGTIEKGKRADLVLIKGTPWERISDLRNTDRVFIDGKLVSGPNVSPDSFNANVALRALTATALIDDFERTDGRSSLDTLRTDDPDGGIDRTVEISQRINRSPTDHALSVAARMAIKAKPFAGVIIPLSRGSIEPVDVRAFRGVRFDIRGDGAYELRVNTSTARWGAAVTADPQWRKVEVPFAALAAREGRWSKDSVWRGDDLTEVEFLGERQPGQKLWMEIDNVEFY
jgi:imidazolonepropionase-like amidohydrolase